MSFAMKTSKKRCSWKEKEILDLISLVKEHHVVSIMDKKTKRAKSLYQEITSKMNEKDYNKNMEQVRSKFKSLKLQYMQIKRNNSKSGSNRENFEYFDALGEIFESRPLASPQGLDTSEETWQLECLEEFMDGMKK